MNISKSPCIGCENQDKPKKYCIDDCNAIKEYQECVSKDILVKSALNNTLPISRGRRRGLF